MHLTHLSLTNFRNYTRLELDLPARIHLFQGANAQGKTNLLEAIYYLATTKSPRTSSDQQLIHWAAQAEVIPHAHAAVTFMRAGEEHTIEAILVQERSPNGLGQVRFRRQLRLDGLPRRALDIVGKLNVVLFFPQDIDLVAGPPAERRRYLDITLCQIDPLYCRTLSRYNRVLGQRNALLRQIREGAAQEEELDYWDEQLIELGSYILAQRVQTTQQLNTLVQERQEQLTQGGERLSLTYQSSVQKDLTQPQQESLLPPNETGEWKALFRQALQRKRSEELVRGVTILGPHRDDVRFSINGIDATIYGSRGQQRTAALALKLSEAELIREHAGESPVLLLDDVISELDTLRSQLLLQAVSQMEQALLTTTDLGPFPRSFLRSTILWQVIGGKILPLDLQE